MRDDGDTLTLDNPAADGLPQARSATIIPFPVRNARVTPAPAAQAATAVAACLDLVAARLGPVANAHGPTALAALGAMTGFAAQQRLIAEGGAAWTQPRRAEHLDRMLIGSRAHNASLWLKLKLAAEAVGAHHLPDPDKLLQSTLRCVGTQQFGMITLPLEYKLKRQPQDLLAALWPAVTASAMARAEGCDVFSACADACAARVAGDQRHVPPHVSLRIVMQAALAMALVEPRLVPAAILKPHAH